MLSLKGSVPFRITLQTVLPGRDALPALEKQLALLQRLGFYGVELNLPDLEAVSPAELSALLARYDLRMTYLATGAYAKARGLSLSSPDAAVRRDAAAGVAANLEYAAAMGVGIILGFFKGTPLPDEARARADLIQSLRAVCAASDADAPILLEATNRRETSVARTLDDAARIVDEVGDARLHILPDTYHMAYEETDPLGEVRRLLPRIPNLHISDDNRFFPGYGGLDFGAYLQGLQAMGYQGTLGVEGNLHTSLEADLQRTAETLLRAAGTL